MSCRQRRDERQDGQHRQHRQILEQQDAERRAAVLRFELTALGQHLKHERRGGQRQSEADDERRGRRQPDEPAGAAEERRAERHLSRAHPEDEPPHDPQASRLQLEADDEQQQHHAEFRHLHDVPDVADEAEPPRSDDQAGRHVSQDGAEAQQAE